MLAAPTLPGTRVHRGLHNEDCALEQVHEALLLIEVCLVAEVVERQYGCVLREHLAHEVCTISVMAPRGGPFSEFTNAFASPNTAFQ